MNNPTKKINFVTFSELRPGVLYADCKDIMLTHWRELKARDEGDISLYKFGCGLSIDVNGKIGRVSYFSEFPEKRVIEGLRLGMSLGVVQSIYPDLTENNCEEKNWREFTNYLASDDLLTLSYVSLTLF